MYKKTHIKRTAEKFGGMEVAHQYAWVHDWLDEIAHSGVSLLKHRQYRHHEKAINNQLIPFVETNYPEADMDLAIQIARQHIIDDLGVVPSSEIDFL